MEIIKTIAACLLWLVMGAVGVVGIGLAALLALCVAVLPWALCTTVVCLIVRYFFF